MGLSIQAIEAAEKDLVFLKLTHTILPEDRKSIPKWKLLWGEYEDAVEKNNPILNGVVAVLNSTLRQERIISVLTRDNLRKALLKVDPNFLAAGMEKQPGLKNDNYSAIQKALFKGLFRCVAVTEYGIVIELIHPDILKFMVPDRERQLQQVNEVLAEMGLRSEAEQKEFEEEAEALHVHYFGELPSQEGRGDRKGDLVGSSKKVVVSSEKVEGGTEKPVSSSQKGVDSGLSEDQTLSESFSQKENLESVVLEELRGMTGFDHLPLADWEKQCLDIDKITLWLADKLLPPDFEGEPTLEYCLSILAGHWTASLKEFDRRIRHWNKNSDNPRYMVDDLMQPGHLTGLVPKEAINRILDAKFSVPESSKSAKSLRRGRAIHENRIKELASQAEQKLTVALKTYCITFEDDEVEEGV